MITRDNSTARIEPKDLEDLRVIADVDLQTLAKNEIPDLFVFGGDWPDPDFETKLICSIVENGQALRTNNMVGFIGRNNLRLSIHSRFSAEAKKDFFLHYMLCRIGGINPLNLEHSFGLSSAFDFLPYLFPFYLKKALTQGIYKEYARREGNDMRPRGRLDLAAHIRRNLPFNGKIAYSWSELSADNPLNQLIRHTMEYIALLPGGRLILESDASMREATRKIRAITSSYDRRHRQRTIAQNFAFRRHPYFYEYAPLRKLCMLILRLEELKYENSKDRIYGVLIDAAWLWEEYLATILNEEGFRHYTRDSSEKFHLFEERRQQIIPDYMRYAGGLPELVADAKYISLERKTAYQEEKATAIYYKTISYMYRFCTDKALLLYPLGESARHSNPDSHKIATAKPGINGGEIINLGLRIPEGCDSFSSFCTSMKTREDDFKKLLRGI